MTNLLGWLNEKAGAAKSFATETASQINTAAKLAYRHSPQLLNISGFTQFWQGFTVATNPDAVPAFVSSKKTQRVAWNSLYSNALWYMGSAITYELMKFFCRSNIPDMANSYPEFGMDCMAAWYFTALSLRMIIDNNSYNICITKTVEEENPNQEHAKQCPCGTVAIARATIASPFYYLSNLTTVKIFEKMLPFGEYLSLPLLAHAYGQCFTEYMIGGMCTEHRYKELAKNNAFCFGLGVSFLLSNYMANWLIRYATGIENSHIEKAIFYMMFQYFIMMSLLSEKPLPGKEVGKDVFFHGRLVMESLLKQGSELIIAAMQNPNTQFVWKPVLDFLTKFRPLQLSKKLFLYEDQQSLMQLVKSPSIELFFDLRGDDIQNVLQWLIDVRNMPITKRLTYVIPYIPNFLLSSEIKKVINFLVREKLDGVLEEVNNFITTARLKIKIYDKKALRKITLPEPTIEQKEEQIPRPLPLLMDQPAVKENKREISITTANLENDFELINALPISVATSNLKSETENRMVIIEDYVDRQQNIKPQSNSNEENLDEDWELVASSQSPKGLQQNSLFAMRKDSSGLKPRETQYKRSVGWFH